MLMRVVGIVVSLIITVNVFGQSSSQKEPPAVESQIWKFHFLLPGLEYERRLGNTTSININPFIGLGYSSNFVFGDAWLVQPSLDVQLRQYYNLYKRSTKGRRVTGNSANFLALSVFGIGRSIVDKQDFRNHYYYGLGPVWGFQRTYKSKFNLSFSTGPAFISDGVGGEGFILRLNIRLGLAWITQN